MTGLLIERWICTHCGNEAPCKLEITYSDAKLPEHLKGRQRLARNVCPCGECPSAQWERNNKETP